MIGELRASSVPLVVVEPTVVYGADRSDALSKMVPVFKFFGVFVPRFKPVTVAEVAENLVGQLRQFK